MACTTIINEFRKFEKKKGQEVVLQTVAALHIKWLENKDGTVRTVWKALEGYDR
jgi:hypothetical protein